MRKTLALAAALALSACAATPPASLPATSPTLMTTSGLEAVLGQTAAGLTRLFGEPSQDFHEPGARKLQFANASCVLDTYLYAQGPGDPVVTYVDARNPQGEDVDRARCVEALRR